MRFLNESSCYGRVVLRNASFWHQTVMSTRVGTIELQPKYLWKQKQSKVENVFKGTLDLIPSPSPSVKIQIMGGKVYLR